MKLKFSRDEALACTFIEQVQHTTTTFPLGCLYRTSGMEHRNGILEWPKLCLKVMGFNYNL